MCVIPSVSIKLISNQQFVRRSCRPILRCVKAKVALKIYLEISAALKKYKIKTRLDFYTSIDYIKCEEKFALYF